MNVFQITLVCYIGLVMALAGGLRADVYSQDFNVADGTTVLGDGSDIRSNNAGMGRLPAANCR